MFQQPYTQPGRDPNRTPDGLRALTIGLTVLKAIPLVLFFFVLILIATVADEFDDFGDLGDAAGDALLAVVLIGMVVIVIGAAMLFYQVRTVMKNQLGGLAVISFIMALLDLLLFASTVFSSPVEASSVLIIGLTLAAQAGIFAWAMTLRSGSRV